MFVSFTLFFSQMKSAAVPDIVSNLLLRKTHFEFPQGKVTVQSVFSISVSTFASA
jgi:hypothetical protein